MSAAKSKRWDQPGERVFPDPPQRVDGELYKRPNHDTLEWQDGYGDGFEGRPERTSIGTLKQVQDYLEGYAMGKQDLEEVQRSGSSNT